MNTRFHDKIQRLGVLLAIATAFTALVAAPALGQDRPASSYYKPQALQRMSDSWAARGGVLTNVPASSYYLPQQIEAMSQGWAARGGLLPASANVATESPAPTGSGRDVEWPQIGIGIGIVLAIVLGLTIKATRPRTFAH